MPHPESEHGLRVQLATALRETERLQEALGDAFEDRRAADRRADAAESALAAARRALESWVRTYGHGDFEASRLTRVALAAPADGEEGKNG